MRIIGWPGRWSFDDSGPLSSPPVDKQPWPHVLTAGLWHYLRKLKDSPVISLPYKPISRSVSQMAPLQYPWDLFSPPLSIGCRTKSEPSPRLHSKALLWSPFPSLFPQHPPNPRHSDSLTKAWPPMCHLPVMNLSGHQMPASLRLLRFQNTLFLL